MRFPGERFQQLQWGHELYCIGHLIQAAVALHRTTADARLLDLARKAADLVTRTFGTEDGQIDGVCGHPEIETALVELFRETGEQSYLATAQYFIDRRGHGLLGPDRFGAALLAGPSADPRGAVGRRSFGPSAVPPRRGRRRVRRDRRRHAAGGGDEAVE